MRGLLLAWIAAATPTLCSAQAGDAAAFPASAVAASADQLTAHLAGKSYYTIYPDGSRVQSKFGADGGLMASTPGYVDRGQWRAEDGKLCGSLRKAGEFCNEARFDGGVLLLRRLNGQIVRYLPD